jgi:hypothetical protein
MRFVCVWCCLLWYSRPNDILDKSGVCWHSRIGTTGLRLKADGSIIADHRSYDNIPKPYINGYQAHRIGQNRSHFERRRPAFDLVIFIGTQSVAFKPPSSLFQHVTTSRYGHILDIWHLVSRCSSAIRLTRYHRSRRRSSYRADSSYLRCHEPVSRLVVSIIHTWPFYQRRSVL